MEVKTVHLQELDGHEFEILCKNIFEDLGYGRVETTPLSGDCGRDLIIHSDWGKIVVECKHQPGNSIGRPVIQKLHSAVISEGAIKGILVTSGKFSTQAIAHAKTLSPTIELIDSGPLLDLASRAGIVLLMEHGHQNILAINTLTDQGIREKIRNLVSHHTVSYPTRPVDTIGRMDSRIHLRPVYKVGYQIDATFTTTVGVIHSIRKQGTFFIDGSNGTFLGEYLANFFNGTPGSEMVAWAELSKKVKGVDSVPFKVPVSSVKERAYEHIIITNTTKVRYSGRNNQIYSKTCAPNRNQIFIGNITQMYIPEYGVDFVMANGNHSIAFAHNGRPEVFVFSDSTAICKFCNGGIRGRRHLCLECGTVTCSKRSLIKSRSHSLSCEMCGKTLCLDCASYTVKFLFFKRIVCSTCGDSLRMQSKAVRRLRAGRQDRRPSTKAVRGSLQWRQQ